MLVLSRKIGESIQIGDDVTIVVNRIAGNRITLAIEAPRSVKIVRGELAVSEDDTLDRDDGKLPAAELPGEAACLSRTLAMAGSGRETPARAQPRRGVAIELDYPLAAGFAPRNAR